MHSQILAIGCVACVAHISLIQSVKRLKVLVLEFKKLHELPKHHHYIAAVHIQGYTCAFLIEISAKKLPLASLYEFDFIA